MSCDTALIVLAFFFLVGLMVHASLHCAAQVKAGLSQQEQGRTVQDLKAKLEKLRTEAEDCELVGRLATDIHKRELLKFWLSI